MRAITGSGYMKGYTVDGHMKREHVENLLEDAFQYPLVTVTSGSGYGKTREVSEWLEDTQKTYVWIQITELDNLSARFWETVCDSIAGRLPAVADQIRRLGFPHTEDKLDRFMELFVNTIYQQDFVYIIFDDFHRLKEGEVKELIKTIVYLRIPNLSIGLLGRYEPGFDFEPELKSRLQYEVTAEDLMFTKEDIGIYFRLRGIRISEEYVGRIYGATEGWPIAVRLLEHEVKRTGIVSEESMKMSQPVIFDLIENELFYSFSENAKSYFVRLSLIDLQDYPTGLLWSLEEGAQEKYEGLFTANMFMQYDAEPDKYHIHHLFLKFLEERQILLSREEMDRTYYQAGKWHEQQGFKLEAILYYQKCKEHDKLFQLILHYGTQPRPQEIARLFMQLIEGLPDDYKKTNGWVGLTYGNLLTHEYRIAEAYDVLTNLKNDLSARTFSEDDETLLGEVCLSLGTLQLLKRDPVFAEYYREAEQHLPNGSVLFDKTVCFISCNNLLGINKSEKGELTKMLAAIMKGLPYASKVMHGCGYGAEYLAAGEEAFYVGDLKRAADLLLYCIEKAKLMEQYDVVYNACYFLIRISAAEGNYHKMMKYKREADTYHAQFSDRAFLAMPEIAQGLIGIKLQDMDMLPRWVIDDTIYSRKEATYYTGRDYIIKALYLLQSKRYYELLALLARMEEIFEIRPAWMMLVITRITKAICFYRLEELEKAGAALKIVYDMAAPNDLNMLFIEFGNDMRSLLHAFRNTKSEQSLEKLGIPDEWSDFIYKKSSAYAKKNAAMISEYRQKQDRQAESSDTDLTEKEIEMLQSLCQGLTREELSEVYQISINTVKSRLKNIYCKLGAINGIDAVRLATVRGLIS